MVIEVFGTGMMLFMFACLSGIIAAVVAWPLHAFIVVVRRGRPERMCVPVLLPNGLTKEDVAVGTEVLLLEEKYEIIQQPSPKPFRAGNNGLRHSVCPEPDARSA
jgi:hypothetical protein